MRDSNCSTSCWITEAISSALNLMDTPIDHLLAYLLQLVGDGAVVDGVADAEDGPGDQGRIDCRLQDGLPAQGGGQRGGDPLGLGRRHGRRGRHADADLTARFLVNFAGLPPDRPQAIQPAVPRHDLEKIQKQFR